MEELVAELASAFQCALLGISPSPREDHAKYLNNWLKVLKGDPKAIFKAAAAAEKAVRFIEDLQPQSQEEAA
jgi:antirestriction protein ArdC